MFCSLTAVLLWSHWGVPYTAKSQRTCNRLMITIGCCLYRSATTHAPHFPTLKPVIGSPQTLPRRLFLPLLLPPANSQRSISPSMAVPLPATFFNRTDKHTHVFFAYSLGAGAIMCQEFANFVGRREFFSPKRYRYDKVEEKEKYPSGAAVEGL